MKRRYTFLSLTAAAALAAVGMYSAKVGNWFSQTFAELADGMSFTGQGAVGGSWDEIPAGVVPVLTAGGRKCLDLDSEKVAAGEIQFSATNALCDIVRVDFAICTSPIAQDAWPRLGPEDKGGICLASTNQIGVLEFAGYTAGGWTNLFGRGLVQRTAEWLDCRAEFEYTTNSVGTVTNAYVTYYQNCSGLYVPLADARNVSRFTAANAGKVSKVAFRGNGYVGDFAGFGVESVPSRDVLWNGINDTGDWDDAAMWIPARVPGDGEVARVNGSATISRSSGTYSYEIYTASGFRHELMSFAGGESLRIAGGDVQLSGKIPGTVSCESAMTLRAGGGVGLEVGGLEMAYGSTLTVDPELVLVITEKPLFLDGIGLDVDAASMPDKEAVVLIRAPYGSGGIPTKLTIGGEPPAGWTVAWHDNLDGSAALWLVNEDFDADIAVWNAGACGNLVDNANWGIEKPATGTAARMGDGQAYLNKDGNFPFARWFEIGAGTDGSASVGLSGGSVSGSGAAIVGAGGGSGTFEIADGAVDLRDYLWNSALTIGAGTNAAGVVRVGVGSSLASRLVTDDGGISVGERGSALLEVGRGKKVGEVSASGPVAVGYDGELVVSGGRLTARNGFYVGRSARGEAYDVSMTVSGGVVSNVTAGSFWVGSYGGIGSKAAMTISGGEVYATNRFVCGGYRSADVEVAGGSLIAPEISVGYALIDDNDYASFVLSSGIVETAGFTSGSVGLRTVTLGGGRIVATATNDDFFAGIDTVRLDGDVMLENVSNIAVKSALAGAGGLCKAGKGKMTVSGYAAWAGPTVVSEGVLDMAGGMVMGELSVADEASIVNAKYDNIDALRLKRDGDWDGRTPTDSPYLLVQFDIDVGVENSASVVEGDVVKGAISFVETDDADSLAFAGWTALGWTRLSFRDGSALADGRLSMQMKFDFSNGKPYVVYCVKRGEVYERLFSEEGLSVFPVAGGLSAEKFVGVGAATAMTLGWQMSVDTARTFYWTGAEDSSWANARNWSHDRSGVPEADAYPNSDEVTAYVEKPAHIQLSTCRVGSLVVNAPVTFAGEGLSVLDGVSGTGTLGLGSARISGSGAATDIRVALDVLDGTDNEIAGSGVSIYGSLRGAGNVSLAAKIFGDTREFSGKVSLVEGGICSADAAHNALSSWNVANSALAVVGTVCEFGALDGSFGMAEDVEIVLGAKGVDCEIHGGLAGRSTVEWIAGTAKLSYSTTNAASLRLSGGGKVAILSSNAVPSSVSFAGAGGELMLGEGVSADVSASFSDSTAPIVFNDNGVAYEWSTAISGSNVGGFEKRGAGTLTWLKAPESEMDVTVREGVLVVPYGTALGYVTVFEGARIVVDTSAAHPVGQAFSATGSNRKLDERYLQFSSPDPGLKRVYGDNNGVVVVQQSLEYVWNTDVEGGLWSATENWLVNGVRAERPPQADDTVSFLRASCTTVRLDAAVCVMKISGYGSLYFVGTEKLSTRLSIGCSDGLLGLDGTTVECGGSLKVRSVCGRGEISVADKTLTVSPASGGSDSFEGVLDVTNLVKRGQGEFRYVPSRAFDGVLNIERGKFTWDCSEHGVTNQSAAFVRMVAGANPNTVLDLAGQSVTVAGFTGSGTVQAGLLITGDGVVTQQGGRLEIPMCADTVYYASRSDEKLELTSDAGTDLGMLVEIVIPRTWFAAGASGRNAIRCFGTNIRWNVQRDVVQKYEGNGWWSISGGGFAVRLR